MTAPKILVNLKTHQRKWQIDRTAIVRYLQNAWREIHSARAAAGANPSSEVTVVFLNDRQMQCYNSAYRNKDYPTDVLSFPVNEVVDRAHYLGDILISMEKTAAQAQEKKHSLKRELRILLLHGMLHLLGYDHETDTGQMDRLEGRLRKKLL